jgi:transposase
MLVAELQIQIKELRAEVQELKARLNTHSGNSSLPPSANPPSAPPPQPKPPTGRKPGGQPGHEGHVRLRLPPERVKAVIYYVPQTCERCRAALPAQAGPHDPVPIWHQVAELPAMAAEITEYQAHARQCACCGHVTWAQIPAAVWAHGFGPRLAAAVVFLSARCHGSKRLVAEIVQTLFSAPISCGSICNIAAEASAALAPAHVQAEQAVRQAPVKHVDETGWSLAGKLCWLWMATTQSVAFFKICAGRGRVHLQELLGENLLGILCTDRWGAYNCVALAMRQLCWAHLKRDFQKCLDRGGAAQVIGQAGRDAVQRVFELWKDFRQGLMDRPALQMKLAPVCAELRAALVAGQESPDKQVRRFCRKLLKTYRALWTFALIEGVQPTNNHAERTLRMAVLWRKISFGNHSDGGCRFTERLLTVVQTLRLQQRNVMAYLEKALIAARAGQPIPALILR